jgi:hypothetical protein
MKYLRPIFVSIYDCQVSLKMPTKALAHQLLILDIVLGTQNQPQKWLILWLKIYS